MIIQNVSIEGYRSHGDEQTITLAEPELILVTGENKDRGLSSAAGKSTIFKAITCALFEETDDDCIKDAGINSIRKNGYSIGVQFLDDFNRPHFVRYSRSHPKYKTDWAVYRHENGKWQDLREEKTGDTKKVIQSILRMDYEQFVNTSYIAQQQVADFIQRTDKERKAIFSRHLRLNECDTYIEQANTLKKEAVRRVRDLTSRAEVLHQQYESVASELSIMRTEDQLHQLLENAVVTETEARTRVNDLQTTISHTAEAQALERDLAATTKLVDDTLKLRADILQKISSSQIGQSELPLSYTLSVIQKRIMKIEQEIQELEAAGVKLHAKIEAGHQHIRTLRAQKAVCTACDQPVDLEKRDKLIKASEAEISQYTRDMERFDRDIEALEKKKAHEEEYHGNMQKMIETENLLNEAVRKEKSLTDQKEVLISTFGTALFTEMANLQAELTAAQMGLEQAVRTVEGLRREMQTTRATKIRHDKLAEDEAKTRADLIIAQQDADQWKRCEELLGDKGFKSDKINASRGSFNDSMDTYLSILTDGEVRAELVTQVPLASGKGFKSELDVLVSDGVKAGIPLRQYSGGEQTSISLAMIGAFADMGEQHAGSTVNLLLLDEPFGMLDAWGEERACQLLAYLRSLGRTVMVVTNRNSVRDRGVFEREIRVVKEHHVSRMTEIDLKEEH